MTKREIFAPIEFVLHVKTQCIYIYIYIYIYICMYIYIYIYIYIYMNEKPVCVGVTQ